MLVERATSETILQTMLALRPTSIRARRGLADRWLLECVNRDGNARETFAKKCLVELEELKRTQADGLNSLDLLINLGRVACLAGEWTKATEYSSCLRGVSEAASDESVRAESAYYADIVDGTVLLEAGDVRTATGLLLRAGRLWNQCPGKNRIPNTMLAKRLLDLGESACVVEYLRQCGESVQALDHELEQWIALIERGVMPYFGASIFN
jgi:hypothetical protein